MNDACDAGADFIAGPVRSFASEHPLIRVGAAAISAGFCAALAACSVQPKTAALDPVAGESASASLQTQRAETVALVTPHDGVAATQTPSSPSLPRAALATAPTPGKIGKSGAGLASWYGDRFHGRPTANGERFDRGGFTAAHRTFPLPSYVRVTNVSNGRSIVVRVNDRGPYHGGRVIDVSSRAADVLGFRSNGVGAVKLDLIGPAPASGSDDRRLLASYQEFGRPAVAPGTQVAMAPVSDAALAAEAQGYGDRAFAIASAAATNSVAYVKSSAASVAGVATAAVRKVLPAARPEPAVAAAAPGAGAAGGSVQAAAYASEPARAPTSIDGAASRVSDKPRVIVPSEPVLASAAPAPGPKALAMDVSSRISAGFEGFDSFPDALRGGAEGTLSATR